jgi:tight adherence protein C
MVRRYTFPAGPGAVLGFAAGVMAIEWFIEVRARSNADALRGTWPHFLHRLRLCLLAGLSLERALATLSEDAGLGRSRALRIQLEEVVREIRAGVSCEGALSKWGELSGLDDVIALSASVERSRALGLPLAAGLARQAAMARERMRQQYLGWVTALPSRLSLGAMLFFLPAILIIVLAPSVLSFLRSGW